jgi:hypothetical protein
VFSLHLHQVTLYVRSRCTDFNAAIQYLFCSKAARSALALLPRPRTAVDERLAAIFDACEKANVGRPVARAPLDAAREVRVVSPRFVNEHALQDHEEFRDPATLHCATVAVQRLVEASSLSAVFCLATRAARSLACGCPDVPPGLLVSSHLSLVLPCPQPASTVLYSLSLANAMEIDVTEATLSRLFQRSGPSAFYNGELVDLSLM